MDTRTNQQKTYEYRPEATNRPLTIANDFHDDPLMRSTLRKSHSLQHPDPLTHAPHTHYNYAGESSSITNPYLRTNAAYGAVGGNTLSGSIADANATTASLHSNDCCVLGATNKDADIVLKFLAYTREAIHESHDETIRIRKIGIVYRPADNSIVIREAVQPNSGIVQGEILSRQRVPRSQAGDPNDILTVDDFVIGSYITVYSKQYFLIDCDESTRKYLRSTLGKSVPDAALPWPTEDDKYNATITKQFSVNPVKRMKTEDMDQKRVAEQLMSGLMSKHAPDEIFSAQQFYKNKINEHLQFAAIWDDRNHISGDLRKCVIRYFLENDTVEIIEARKENCGREGGAKLLIRQRLAKPGVDPLTAKAQQNTFGVILKRDFLEAADFRVGEAYTIHKVKYFLYDADDFTRRFFEEKLNTFVQPRIDISEIEARGYVAPPKHSPPAHDGLGTEEDSLQNWKHLMLKPPPVNPKQELLAGKVLSFTAEFHMSTAPEDAGRQFVIKYYCATDNVEIFEHQGRNSGIIGGKFLVKARHMKVLNSGSQVPFSISDFQVGKPIKVCSREFMLTGQDLRSTNIVNNVPDVVTEQRIRELVVVFKNILTTKFVRLHEAYRAVAPQGSLTVQELRDVFDKSVCPISEEEAVYLINYISPGGNGVVSFEEFVAQMDVPNSQNMDVTSLNPRSIRNINMTLNDSVKSATMKAMDVNLTRRLKRMLIDKISQRRGTLQEAFLLLGGHSATAKLAKKPFSIAMNDLLHFNVTPKEEQIVLDQLFPNGAQELTFKQFHEFVESDI